VWPHFNELTLLTKNNPNERFCIYFFVNKCVCINNNKNKIKNTKKQNKKVGYNVKTCMYTI